jgi:hypothetical protein
MSIQSYELSLQALGVSALAKYLQQRRPVIYGPRTLGQAYAACRMLVISHRIKMTDEEYQIVRKADPCKMDWVSVYAWWKDLDATAS